MALHYFTSITWISLVGGSHLFRHLINVPRHLKNPLFFLQLAVTSCVGIMVFFSNSFKSTILIHSLVNLELSLRNSLLSHLNQLMYKRLHSHKDFWCFWSSKLHLPQNEQFPVYSSLNSPIKKLSQTVRINQYL